MTFRAITIALACAALSACTTVNMTSVEGALPAKKAAVQDNVVVKASDRLQTHFTEKGWISEPVKLKTAAMILLRGRDAGSERAPGNAYSRNVSPAVLKADIAEATQMAGQTLKAADVYLTYADPAADLTMDLQALEGALLACRKAENTFTLAGDQNDVLVDAEMGTMSATLSNLQSVTDIYGQRVRDHRITAISPSEPVN